MVYFDPDSLEEVEPLYAYLLDASWFRWPSKILMAALFFLVIVCKKEVWYRVRINHRRYGLVFRYR